MSTPEGSERPTTFQPVSLDTPKVQFDMLSILYTTLLQWTPYEDDRSTTTEFREKLQRLRGVARELILSLGENAKVSDETIVEMGIPGIVSTERLREFSSSYYSPSNLAYQAEKLLRQAIESSQ